MINLVFAEFFFALILLLSAYVISHTLNGFLQAYFIDILGDSTAKDEGYLTLNPLDHIDFFGVFAVIFFGIGWYQTVPIDPYAIQGALRYTRIFIAFMTETLISIGVATLSLVTSIVCFGLPLTRLLILKLFIYYKNFFIQFLTSTAQLNIASVFDGTYSTLSVTFAFLLVSLVYFNILIATISCIFNFFRYLLVIGFEKEYTYMEYADYVVILGPFLVIYVFGNVLTYQILLFAESAACSIAVLLGLR